MLFHGIFPCLVWIEPSDIRNRIVVLKMKAKLDFENTMEHIVASIRSAGYEPYDQLYAYLKTGNESYITRVGDARRLVKELNSKQLRQYVRAISGNKQTDI